jgi:alkaline phosphatase
MPLMMHHSEHPMQNSTPSREIPSLSVHGEPNVSLVQNKQFGFFLMIEVWQ